MNQINNIFNEAMKYHELNKEIQQDLEEEYLKEQSIKEKDVKEKRVKNIKINLEDLRNDGVI